MAVRKQGTPIPAISAQNPQSVDSVKSSPTAASERFTANSSPNRLP